MVQWRNRRTRPGEQPDAAAGPGDLEEGADRGVVEAYGLTPREVEVTRLVARGLSTNEIAERMFLSRHTVRDHLKAIFEKVGVSSRGELTSRLFAEHYNAPLDAAIDGASERTAARMSAIS